MYYYENYTGPVVKFHGAVGVLPASLKKLSASLDDINFNGVEAAGAEDFVDISSSDATDTSLGGGGGGVGARTVLIFGLTKGLGWIKETVALKGTTVVTSTKKFFRVFSIEVLTAGASLTNVGDLYAIKTGSSAVYTVAGIPDTKTSLWIKLLAAAGIGESGVFTVPVGYRYSLQALSASSLLQATVFGMRSHAPASALTATRIVVNALAGPSETLALPDIPQTGQVFEAGTDLYLKGIALTAGANVDMTVWLKAIAGTPMTIS